MSSSEPLSSPAAHPELRQRAASGVLWSVASSVAHQIAGLAIFAILARQLTPAEFGLMAMASIALEIVSLVSRAGLIEVLVQRKDPTQAEMSTAFWSSLAIGAAGSLLLWLAAGPIAAFFRMPEVRSVIRWLSLLLIINAAGTVHEALLRRAFGFRALAVRGVVATALGGLVAVAMATAGLGVASLIAQALVGALAMLAILWWLTRWTPSWSFERREFVRQMRMGLTLCVSTLLATGNQKIVDIVIGRTLGAVPLGFMRVAWRGFDLLLDLGMRPVSGVSFSLLSRMQHDLSALGATYLRLVRLTAVIIYPIFLGAVVVAPEVIRIMFGSQWEDSIRLMQVLALSVLSMPAIYFKSNALLAVGHARPVLWLNVVEFAVSFGIAIIFCQFGLVAAAWGNVVRVIVIVVPVFWALRRHIGIRWTELLKALVPAAVCSALMLVGTVAARWILAPHVASVPLLLIVVSTGASIYALALRLSYPHLLVEIVSFLPAPLRRLLEIALALRPAAEGEDASARRTATPNP